MMEDIIRGSMNAEIRPRFHLSEGAKLPLALWEPSTDLNRLIYSLALQG